MKPTKNPTNFSGGSVKLRRIIENTSLISFLVVFSLLFILAEFVYTPSPKIEITNVMGKGYASPGEDYYVTTYFTKEYVGEWFIINMTISRYNSTYDSELEDKCFEFLWDYSKYGSKICNRDEYRRDVRVDKISIKEDEPICYGKYDLNVTYSKKKVFDSETITFSVVPELGFGK